MEVGRRVVPLKKTDGSAMSVLGPIDATRGDTHRGDAHVRSRGVQIPFMVCLDQ